MSDKSSTTRSINKTKTNESRQLKRLEYWNTTSEDKDESTQLFKNDFDVVGFAHETRNQRPKRMLKDVIRFEPTNIPDNKAKKMKSALGENVAVGEGFQCPRCGACCFYDDTQCRHCGLKCRYMAGVGVVVFKDRSDVQAPVKDKQQDWFISVSDVQEKKASAAKTKTESSAQSQPARTSWDPLPLSKVVSGLPRFLSLQSSPQDLTTLLNTLAKHIKYIKSSVQAAIDMDSSYTSETRLFKKCLRERALSVEFERLEKHKAFLRNVQNRVYSSKGKALPVNEWKKFISRPLLFDGRVRRYDESCSNKNCPLCDNYYFKALLDVSPSPTECVLTTSALSILSPRFREIPSDDEDALKQNFGICPGVVDDNSKQRKKLFDLQEARNNLLFIKRYNQGFLNSRNQLHNDTQDNNRQGGKIIASRTKNISTPLKRTTKAALSGQKITHPSADASQGTAVLKSNTERVTDTPAKNITIPTNPNKTASNKFILRKTVVSKEHNSSSWGAFFAYDHFRRLGGFKTRAMAQSALDMLKAKLKEESYDDKESIDDLVTLIRHTIKGEKSTVSAATKKRDTDKQQKKKCK